MRHDEDELGSCSFATVCTWPELPADCKRAPRACAAWPRGGALRNTDGSIRAQGCFGVAMTEWAVGLRNVPRWIVLPAWRRDHNRIQASRTPLSP